MSTRISSKVTEDGDVGARGLDSESGRDDKERQNLEAESSGGEEERDKAIRDNAEFARLNKKPL